ncbi:MAG: site-specific integrase [Myxococcales bacterium]|nr:site-specific integrase [Myxococcales bacterium]USN50873.1 MAG: site-specific integrase [Myxococcales bacterium]
MEHLEKGQLQKLRSNLIQNEKSDCRIRARNDVEAFERWLDEYFEKPTTYRSYKKEGERFLVWCALERNCTLETLSRDDVEAYISFLKNPQPFEKWCGPKGGRSHKGIWKPFSGPLGESAIRCALAILNSMMGYLVDAGYVSFNAFALIRRKSRLKEKLVSNRFSIEERILSQEEWRVFLQTMRDYPENNSHEVKKKQRLIFLVTILYFLGLRIDELAQSTWANFRQLNGKWWFFVRGKGDKLGKIPINRNLWQAVIKFRLSLAMSPIPHEEDYLPIIPSLSSPQKTLTTRQMSNLLKELALKAALQLKGNPHSAKKMEKFSPHWLRHLSASRQDLAGVSFTHIKENLRHSNEQTTRHYVHAFDDKRHEEMEKFNF